MNYQMYISVTLLFVFVYFLPVYARIYIELSNNDIEHAPNINPLTRKFFNKINHEKHLNGRKSANNNIPGLKWSESELNRIIRGHKLEAYLSQDEIHEIKVKEICDFIKSHYLTADYFFDEMRRIINQREVKDDLRKMVMYFEENPNLKPKILEAFRKIKVLKRQTPDMWSLQTNNLVASLDASRYN